jgi:capsular polysaccharide biosynthesis protein
VGKRAKMALRTAANVMSLGTALKRSWLVVLACVLACCGVAVAVGLVRSPDYKAQSQLFVGSFDVRSVAIPGFVTASVQLADAYSRLATSDAVVVPVARQLGLTRGAVRERLTASNVPGSPVVRITAEGLSRRAAIALARAASEETAAQVRGLTNRNGEADQLLRRFQAASAQAARTASRAGQLRGQHASAQTILAAEAQSETARLRANTIGSLYGQARANSGGAAQVHVINAAQSATNDRGQVLQQLILVGALAGLVAGAALAALREHRLLQSR